LKAKRALIVTGQSLKNNTPVIKYVETLLGDKHLQTFSKISEHAPIQHINDAAKEAKREGIDVIISVGGGSPIDSAKGIPPVSC
jgi:alcohol dehydrogenase class IV